MNQCEYILDSGQQCKRTAKPGSKYCWQHQSSVRKKSRGNKSSSKQIISKDLYFSLLPTELLHLLFLHFSSSELRNILFELENIRNFSRLFISKPFWQKIWKRDISSLIDPPSDPSNTYQEYKEIFDYLAFPYYRNNKIAYLAQIGYDRLLLPLLITKWDYDLAMMNAAYGGHIEIVNLMIKNGANYYHETIAYAARGGHIEIVKLMLEKGASNYDMALALTDKYNHPEIVNLIESYKNQ